MKIDLSCPIELWQYATPTEEHPVCRFVMNNLGEKIIVSVQVTLVCYDAQQNPLFRQTERIQGFKVRAGNRFTFDLTPNSWENVQRVELTIERVWFDDSSFWQKETHTLTNYEPNQLEDNVQLSVLRSVAGDDAIGYPSQQEGCWLCVCGRPNANDVHACCRCGREYVYSFGVLNQKNIEEYTAANEKKLKELSMKANTETNTVREDRDKEIARRTKWIKRILWTIVILALVALLAAAGVLYLKPHLEYKAAEDALNSGRFTDARNRFEAMGDYKDAADQVKACDYQKALQLKEAGEESKLEEARTLFNSLSDYEDSADQSAECSYMLAEMYLSEERYEAAADEYLALGDYRDSAQRRVQASLKQADVLFEAGNYEAAKILYQAFQDHEDARNKITECDYEIAKAAFTDASYEEAIPLLEPLSGMKDVDEMLKAGYYKMAETEAANENYELAGQYYLLAGDYKDAVIRGNDCVYRTAHAKKDEGAFAEAAELFAAIPNYLDSEGEAQDCLYQQAAILHGEERDSEAVALLEGSARSAEAQELLYLCYEALGNQALNNGDTNEAERFLELANGRGSSKTQLKSIRYQLAEAAYESGNYADALSRYEILGSYSDCEIKAKRCRYELAVKALEDGRFTEAADSFSELKNYKDSKAQREKALICEANRLKGENKVEDAKALLVELGTRDAKTALSEIVLEEGAALEAQARYEEAEALYKTVNTASVKAQLKACRYLLARQLFDQGEYIAAGEKFYQLGNYEDAPAQSEKCYTAYYGTVAESAREAMKQKQYQQVIQILCAYEMTQLSKNYQDLPDLFKEACFKYAEQLYEEDPYQALPYYEKAIGYKSKVDRRLDSRCYLILGDWKSKTGETAVFTPDGKCRIFGRELFFRVTSTELLTGVAAGSMQDSMKLTVVKKDSMTLWDQNDQEITFERVGNFELPILPIPEESQERFEEPTGPLPEAEEPADA